MLHFIVSDKLRIHTPSKDLVGYELTYIIVATNIFCCRMHNKISPKGKGFLIERCGKSAIYTDQSPFFTTKFGNQLNVNTPEEWISRRLCEEKRNLHRSKFHKQSGSPMIC